jgi:hypothetical protein
MYGSHISQQIPWSWQVFSFPWNAKNAFERVLGASFATQEKRARLQIVDIGQVEVILFPGNLINADMGNAGEVSVIQTISNYGAHGCGDRAPGTLE